MQGKETEAINQSDYIGKGLSKESGIKFNPKLIKRRKFTQNTDKSYPPNREKINVSDIFIPYGKTPWTFTE